jgi:hypothetical protein
MAQTSGTDKGSRSSMDNYRDRDPYYDYAKWKGKDVEVESSVLFYTFVPWRQMMESTRQWTTKPVGVAKWNKFLDWKAKGNIFRVLYATPDIAKGVVERGPFKQGEFMFVPQRMTDKPNKYMGKHYDKRLKTKVWMVESWWIGLDRNDIKKTFDAGWSNKECNIKSIFQQEVGGVRTPRWRVLTTGPGTIEGTFIVCGEEVIIWKLPYKKHKKYPADTKAQEGVPPSHAYKIPSETPMDTSKGLASKPTRVVGSISKLSTTGIASAGRAVPSTIGTRTKAQKTAPSAQPKIDEVWRRKVSTNTSTVSRDPVPLAQKDTSSAGEKGKAILEKNKLPNLEAATARKGDAKRKAGNESESLSAVEGRSRISRKIEESSDETEEMSADSDDDSFNEEREWKVRYQVFPQAKCARKDCGKNIKAGKIRLRREDKNWCFGCTSCSKCKEDFQPDEVDERNNIMSCGNCENRISIVKAMVTVEGESFQYK